MTTLTSGSILDPSGMTLGLRCSSFALLQWTDKVVRIGGWSKSEVLENYNLSATKKKVKIHDRDESNYPYYASEMQAVSQTAKFVC